MAEVTIRNKDLLKTLDGFVESMLSVEGYDDPKYWMYSSEDDMSRGEYYCSEEYLRDVSLKGDLVGPPDRHFAQPIAKMVREERDLWSDYMQRVKFDFAAEIGAHTSALLSYYPPGGFVGWHTNYDASAYQVLFTWSKTGNGYFRYYDKEKDEIVTIQDKVGWQCRHYYFGPENEPHNHCWHSAYAGDERITLAYKFCGYGENDPRDKQARDLRDMLIEEIESE
jgi:hypothetical protein